MLRGIVQFDTLNEVNIRLSDGTKAFNYDGYTNIVFKVLKADGTAYIDSEGENVIATSPVDGIVTVYLTGQSTTAAGLCQSVLEIYSGDGKMTTARFNYEVFENLDTNEAIESTTEYPALQNLMTDLSGIKADAAVASGYVARSEAAAKTAEMWARAAQDIAEGDYATRAELDAVAEGAAPAGFGLGGVATQLTSADDLNTVFEEGWYYWGSSAPANAPKQVGTEGETYVLMRVNSSHTTNVVQEYWSLSYNLEIQTRRICRNGTWGALEFVNPPMRLAVEYRTTERFIGKPVYRKVVKVALPENKASVVASLPSGGVLIDYGAVVQKKTDETIVRVFPFSESVGDADKISCWNEGGSVYLKTYAEGWTAYQAYITVKYTKTTDT